jgi:hypothetical protein
MGNQNRVYYYYPAYGHKYVHTFPSGDQKERVYARKVLAGVVSNGKIYIAEAQCFTGDKEKAEPDQFNKKRGREIAEARAYRAAGFELQPQTVIKKKDDGTEYEAVEQVWTYTGNHKPQVRGKNDTVVSLEVPIPDKETAIGKLFVQEVEKHYPKHIATPKKAKA